MKHREAIEKAKALFLSDRSLEAILNQTGTVRIPVFPDIQAVFTECDLSSDGAHIVTFTIEETHFGRRLLAEFHGYKEFVA